MGWARHSVCAAGGVAPGDRRARSNAPYLPSPAACRAANSPYSILGLLPDPEGGLNDLTGLYLDKFGLLPAGQRIFIQTVQQINGWRDLPPNSLRPYPHPVGRAPQKPAQTLRFPAHPWAVSAPVAQCPPLYPLYTPCNPPLLK